MGEQEQRVLAAADDLYAVPLSDFTRRRDAAAAAARDEDRDLAAAIKSLRKPTVAAWAVNLFVRRESAQVDQLLDLGVALRDAQEALDGEELRALSRQRRQVTAALATQVRTVAQQEGQRLTEAVVEQVESTLTAALLDEQVAVALRSGMLLQALRSTGLDAADLTAAVALPEALGFTAAPREAEEPSRPVLRLVPDPERRSKERRAAKEALAEAERALARAGRARRTAQRRVDDLEARLLRVRSEAEELRRRLADLEAEGDEVEEELSEAEELRDESDEDLTTAQAERDEAAATVAGLAED